MMRITWHFSFPMSTNLGLRKSFQEIRYCGRLIDELAWVRRKKAYYGGGIPDEKVIRDTINWGLLFCTVHYPGDHFMFLY
jgi:hypothetical protein